MGKFYIYNKEEKKYFKSPQGGLTPNKNEAHRYTINDIDNFEFLGHRVNLRSKPNIEIIEVDKAEDLAYWRINAEENYMTTPISVLRYIAVLEKELKSKNNV